MTDHSFSQRTPEGDMDNIATPSLDIVTWAKSEVNDGHTNLRMEHSEQTHKVHGARDATGHGLVTNGALGADLIRLPAGAGFEPHTHPGHHILAVVGGVGTITYAGRVHETHAGQVYLVEGEVPHAVGAITDHVILAIGSPHKAVDAEDRMAPVPYEEIVTPFGDLTCMICDLHAARPARLHDVGCGHCPCQTCVGGGDGA
jgi:quercetin dioxygenase-like cupin family protein